VAPADSDVAARIGCAVDMLVVESADSNDLAAHVGRAVDTIVVVAGSTLDKFPAAFHAGAVHEVHATSQRVTAARLFLRRRCKEL